VQGAGAAPCNVRFAAHQNCHVAGPLVSAVLWCLQVANEGVYDVGLVTPSHLQPFFKRCSFELDHEESVPMALQRGWDKDVQEINAGLQGNQALRKLLQTAMNDDQRRLFATL